MEGLVQTSHAQPVDSDREWTAVSIPDTWKEPPRVRPAEGSRSGRDGFAWYRCGVEVPASWADQSIELFVEPVDDARAAYVNGVQVGAAGTFPPQFRSGLGERGRYRIPDGVIHAGARNVVAVRVYYNDGRSNFSVAAPSLYVAGGEEAIRLEGLWEYQPGDDPAWAHGPVTLGEAVYRQVDRVENLDTYLAQRQGDTNPLTPGEARDRFLVADDLTVDLVLGDPDISQPLQVCFDERGRLWVVEYRQYPEPAGLTAVSRDKFLRTVYDRLPEPPPRGTPGRDRISIHEDRDGDGTFETHKVFVDGLNLATSMVRGRGGVWVLNPPYLLFYADHDGDDVPDGDPEVHLEGFGLEDSHSLCNSLRWGPDGWLYAAQGSTVTGRVRRPGESDEAIIPTMGQLIWRYQPQERRYEVFAEGGGNTFGVEIDAKGRIFSGHNGGDTRGFHYVQGGYSQKGFTKHGALSNPYAFGYFPPMAHHSVPRFTHTFLIEEGGALPHAYRGLLFGVEPLQGQVVASEISPDGSTFQTRDISRPVTTDDPWFRPVEIKLGPDGAIYIADFYEQRIDHSSHYAGRIDRSNGRIYRIRTRDAVPGHYPGDRPPQPPFDLAAMSGLELLEMLHHPNRWFRQEVLRILGDRGDRSLIPPLREGLARREAGQTALEYLWALNLSGGLDEQFADELLDHPDPYVRAWTVRLLCDDGEISAKFVQRLGAVAKHESYNEVRSQIASSVRRLPASQALPIVSALASHDEDATDPHLPLLIWWAIEAKVGESPEAVLRMFESPSFWDQRIVREAILGRLMRRFARAATRGDFLACAEMFERSPSKEHTDQLMAGFEEALEGRSLAGLPDRLVRALIASGGGSLPLRVRQGVPAALAEARARIAESQVSDAERIGLIQALSEMRHQDTWRIFLKIATSQDSPTNVKLAAIAALRPFDDSGLAADLLRLLPGLTTSERETALDVLASRRGWALSLLDAIEEGRLPRESVPESTARKLQMLGDPDLSRRATNLWGGLEGATNETLRRQVERLAGLIASNTGNPYNGKVIYRETCGKCHTLFDEGGDIGPTLTSYQRSDLRAMLMAVVNPSAEIREGYETHMALMTDGRVASGFLVDQDERVVVLRAADGLNQVLPREEIEEFRSVGQSIMPTGLLDSLEEQQVRDLFAYLRSTQPLNE